MSESSSSTSSRDSSTTGSCDSVCLDMGSTPWGGQAHTVPTSHGPISVVVCGDQEKPALITYPDLALDSVSCYDRFFSCREASSMLSHNFCIYHIDAPGHEFGAASISSDQPVPTVEDLSEQVAQVCDHFGLHKVICFGVTAGAYILTLFALKYRERVHGLILVSPICKSPTWTEWIYNKAMISFLYFWGISSFVRENLLNRYFSQEILGSDTPNSDVLPTFNKVLDERQSRNVMRFLQALHHRKDLSQELKYLRCRTLIFVGEHSPFYDEAVRMYAEMGTQYSAIVEVQACGSLVTEEQPLSMLIPLEYFLKVYPFYRPPQLYQQNSSPTSPLSPPCILAELLSSESLGLKLKPIKTRVQVGA